MEFDKSNAKREVHSNTSLRQEKRETSNKQTNFTHKQLEKNNKNKNKKKPQSQQKERNHKNQSKKK